MPSDQVLLERQMADIDLRPFTLDEFHHRRHRKQRNRRIATAVMALVLLAVVAAGVIQTLGQDDAKVESSVLGPGPSPFAGTWTSSDNDGSSQTMEIRRTEGDEHEVVLRDGSAGPCGDGPSTEAGIGSARSVTELAVPLELTCDDGSTPSDDTIADFTFVLDPATGELTDSAGVVWRRPGASEGASAVVEGPSPFEGSWVVGRAGQYFPDSLEIRIIGDDDLHELVMLKAETPQCGGGASTMSGTGRRESSVRLAVVVDLTCDDGSTPIPQLPQEEGAFVDLGINFTRDPVTDELLGSLGSLFVRQGAELAEGDPTQTVEQMIDAVNARDTDAFVDLFAPDGAFDPRGGFQSTSSFGQTQPTAEIPLVRAWMAIQDAWDFEADVVSCTANPAEPLSYSSASNHWIDCEVAARWPKLSLEITDRWRFELRGARLVYWAPEPLDLDPSSPALPLGYSGLEAWESWLEANHPEDAARWLNPRAHPSAADFEGDQDVEDPEREAQLAPVLWPAQQPWTIDGLLFVPAGLVPYDPAFADDIEASINEYLEEQ